MFSYRAYRSFPCAGSANTSGSASSVSIDFFDFSAESICFSSRSYSRRSLKSLSPLTDRPPSFLRFSAFRRRSSASCRFCSFDLPPERREESPSSVAEPPEEEPADYQQMLIRKAIDIGVADLQRVEIEPLSKPFFYWTTIAEEVPQRVANDELAMVEGNLSVEEFLARWEEEINAAIQEALEAGTS